MSQSSWTNDDKSQLLQANKGGRLKFFIGGGIMIVAIIALVINAMSGNMQLYKTVGEFYAEQDELVGRDLRVSGWVIGETIQYTQIDATTSRLEFEIVDDLNNPEQRLRIVAMNEPKPDLLQHEAQALVEGRVYEGGVLETRPGGLYLKCPTRYEELDLADSPHQ
jgi:cytochrome c-type biogenesis protein CcmE